MTDPCIFFLDTFIFHADFKFQGAENEWPVLRDKKSLSSGNFFLVNIVR